MATQKKNHISSNQGSKKKKTKPAEVDIHQPWISMRSGLIIISIMSIGMAVMTAIQAVPTKGLVNGILWGIFFGGLIWIVFLGYYLFVTRVLRRRK